MYEFLWSNVYVLFLDAGEKHPPTRPSSRESKSRGRLRTPPAVQLAVNTVAVVPEHSAPAVIPEAKPGLNFADFVSVRPVVSLGIRSQEQKLTFLSSK